MRLGTGKSVLLREIIKTLRKKYVKSPDAVAVTASTGIYTLLLLWETVTSGYSYRHCCL
jgi:hypothetical protein